MKNIFIIFSSFLLFSFTTNAQKQITVNLETRIEDSGYPYYFFTYLIDKINYSKFEGIPKSLINKNSVIRYFKPSRIDSVFILIGDLDSLNRICIIDINKNLDFSDDYIYQFYKHKITKKSQFPPQLISFKKKENGKEVLEQHFYSPYFFDSKNLNFTDKTINNLHHKYYLSITTSERKEGYITLNDKEYKLTIRTALTNKNYSIVDDSLCDDEKLRLSKKTIPCYKEMIINNFRIKNCKLSNNNSIATLDIDDLNILSKDEKRGYLEHLYALPFEKKDINDNYFKLKDYEGNYVLLDFWGTWCNPCIALLPHIAELHKKYPKLKIISLASERNEKGKEKINSFVKKYKMDWTNICDLNGTGNDISSLYKVSSYPTTILIAPDGEIIHRGGSKEIPELDKKLEKAFRKKD